MANDHALQSAVLAALRFEPSINAAHIGVSAEDGVVTLTGHVTSYPQKFAAEAATARVRGVNAVAEEIEVRLPHPARRTDDEIAAEVVRRLDWDSAIPPGAVKVKVERGWVTLYGEVEWRFERDLAQDDVRRLKGVMGISNQMTVRPRVDVAGIGGEISHALHRSWLARPAAIEVTAHGGRVRLSGSVSSPHERQLAAAAAWSAPGVTEVENDIVVA
jgi:osmotically-inducible protein OsmY